MNIFAIIEGNRIKDIAIAESDEVLKIILPQKSIIKETEKTGIAWVGAEVIENRFMPMKPYSSWIFNSRLWKYEAPIPYPNPQKLYSWNESSKSWDEVIFD